MMVMVAFFSHIFFLKIEGLLAITKVNFETVSIGSLEPSFPSRHLADYIQVVKVRSIAR